MGCQQSSIPVAAPVEVQLTLKRQLTSEEMITREVDQLCQMTLLLCIRVLQTELKECMRRMQHA